MSWPFLAVFFSGWLFVDASYRGPHWQRWVFKPLTLVLLLYLAWLAPTLGIPGYLIVLGLLATLAGDTLLLLSGERTLYAIGAFFLSHLLYTLSFASQMTFSLFWPLPLVLLVIGGLLLAILWNQLGEIRWPIAILVAMSLLMVWLAGEQYFLRSSDLGFSLLVGTFLLLLANIVWLLNRYRLPFRAAEAIIAFCYFSGHFLIVHSLYL